MSSEIAVKVSHVGKTFHESQGAGSFKEAFINFGRKLTGKKEKRKHRGEYRALKDIYFEVEKGDFFGIVGRNGCGKSTLLKIIAGVYSPTKGSVLVNGSLTPFIELGVGFNPELSGRDNVYLNGALLGFTRKQMEAMYDDIVEFAELKGFMDTKLKNYSSGMQVRLAFSVAIRAESDILLIDEVLAVGDAAFQQKCFKYFEKLKRDKRTIIFVTHDMSAVRQFCDKAIYIEDGQIIENNKPQVISDIYDKKNYEKEIDNNAGLNSRDIKVSTTVEGNKTTSVKAGKTIEFKIDWTGTGHEVNIVGCVIKSQGQVVFATNSLHTNNAFDSKKTTFLLPKIILGNGRYTMSLGLFGKDRYDLIGFYDDIVSFSVYGNLLSGSMSEEWSGMFYLESAWN
jgi:ABC-type polysaccharide/polyol phosphate transport system ATPase subunit